MSERKASRRESSSGLLRTFGLRPFWGEPVFWALGFHGVREVFGCSSLLDSGTFGRHRGGIAKDRCAARGFEEKFGEDDSLIAV
jgi:hypothetical protein